MPAGVKHLRGRGSAGLVQPWSCGAGDILGGQGKGNGTSQTDADGGWRSWLLEKREQVAEGTMGASAHGGIPAGALVVATNSPSGTADHRKDGRQDFPVA